MLCMHKVLIGRQNVWLHWSLPIGMADFSHFFRRVLLDQIVPKLAPIVVGREGDR